MKGSLVLRVIKFKGLFTMKTITIFRTTTIKLNMRKEKVHTNMVHITISTQKKYIVGISFRIIFFKLMDNKNIDQLEACKARGDITAVCAYKK